MAPPTPTLQPQASLSWPGDGAGPSGDACHNGSRRMPRGTPMTAWRCGVSPSDAALPVSTGPTGLQRRRSTPAAFGRGQACHLLPLRPPALDGGVARRCRGRAPGQRHRARHRPARAHVTPGTPSPLRDRTVCVLSLVRCEPTFL